MNFASHLGVTKVQKSARSILDELHSIFGMRIADYVLFGQIRVFVWTYTDLKTFEYVTCFTHGVIDFDKKYCK